MSSNPPPDGINGSPAPAPKPVSLSLGSKNPISKTVTSNKFHVAPKQTLTRRPHHHDDDSDDELAEPAFESVSGFDTLTGKTISSDGASQEKKPLTIPVASGNNWRDRPGVVKRARGGKNLLPKEVQAMEEARRKGVDVSSGGESVGPSPTYGLSFAHGQDAAAPEKNGDGAGGQEMNDAAPVVEEERKPLTEDEIALRALVRESKGEVEGRSDLVIESRRAGEEDEDGMYDEHPSETKSFRADIAARPESATLDQYNAIPVEEFGAALLRGMGWKEGQAVGKNYGSADLKRANTPHVPARRPGFLGIGAKDVSNGKAEVELGAWGKAAMRKGSRKAGEEKDGERNTEGVYMPVLMRNKKTGETITPEELSALAKESKKRNDEEDWKERRDRNLERSGRDKDRHRDREARRIEYDDYDRSESRRNAHSRRDRSRSAGDRHSRRRKYDDEDSSGGDSRYYRDRDRDWERDRDSDRDRDRDRRSQKYRDDDRYCSRHSSSTTSSRHRDRDRDRDSDRDSRRRR
ncbi:DExH-box splicing factor binding site-domain-containing protein [Aspergillus karnatakaensis]|uniref:spliceosome ATPase-activating subunit SPP2 n=1 Tax=Aspergillus karnatakaensis TaxID=1810916 RepID=UPI003CCD8803